MLLAQNKQDEKIRVEYFNLLETLRNRLDQTAEDDERSESIIDLYNELPEHEQMLINDLFYYLCGRGLFSLEKEAEKLNLMY